MKKFMKIFSIVVQLVDQLYYLLKDYQDDGKINGSATR